MVSGEVLQRMDMMGPWMVDGCLSPLARFGQSLDPYK